MRYFIASLLLFIQVQIQGQVKGNQQIITRYFELENLTSLDINVYADVEVDANTTEGMMITGDENLMDLIHTTAEMGHLKLTQKEWIQPSQPLKVIIGAPNLERIQQSTHNTTRVINLDCKEFRAIARIGGLELQGMVNTLYAASEIGEIDARKFESALVDVNLWGAGKILLGSTGEITGVVKQEGLVLYEDNDTQVNISQKRDGVIYTYTSYTQREKPETRYISFKIKNNSTDRIDCYVSGPKPEGGRFGYGFPLKPQQARKERWTTGTKVYQVSKLGTKKLLVEIAKEDEGAWVRLFD